jgi:hypothetical protein
MLRLSQIVVGEVVNKFILIFDYLVLCRGCHCAVGTCACNNNNNI